MTAEYGKMTVLTRNKRTGDTDTQEFTFGSCVIRGTFGEFVEDIMWNASKVAGERLRNLEFTVTFSPTDVPVEDIL